ncbi:MULTISPECIES: LacI family DNA-binding transcriptional regulator [Streptomyces]|uniref:Substrate-binding domain-containing protein n=2 Tax=Streptomyces griseoaurantiacus TaxID=68213 RepID=A0A7W2DRW2_9ACTN|nr:MULTISPECIES: substrate-binding domain-containing protein [Streptomyces]MBA5221885.1 substrate-binding domain-containing protein [Streptomyces griseoaurantiacus]MDX3088253.1 substrate-binding domain-containing protein [Streptomyces sp. ME12-02E]MDX3331584.1 substrate-binding domain-containing protein [Streptomyces sp. ME02-6978a]MDX3358319.1 substrate-binding domain-containing protein [Streptomyces sp. ME02-6978.2a]NJP73502.1 LacI family transcriptional regulator [Streptomyces sp. C1-2]
MRPNARRTTLADIARAAGVSVATVSKVVNGRGDVAPHTRTRVQELLHQHQYLAPVFRHSEAEPVDIPTIEVQFQGGLRSYVAETLEGIIDSAAELGATVVVSKATHAPHWARDLVAAGRRAVIAVTSVYTAAHLNELARSGLPLVVLDPLHLPDSRVHSVGATNFAGGLTATRHLLSLGHRRIAYLGGPSMAVCNQARMHGYRAAMEAEGAKVPESYVRPGEFTYATGLHGAAGLLDLPEPPTAVFAGNDDIAVGVIEAARARGMRVPEDLSVVGFDDTSLAEMASPPLTTVRQPLREMGGAALRTALRLANGETIESHHIELATALVVRTSTAPPREEP